MVHSFGIKLVYPGSIGFMKSALADHLETGREKWTLEKHGIRYKLETIDGNHIDTMFFDRRNSSDNTAASSRNGNTLVVSCEGNAGFYEIGVLSTPMDAGYSVLGWNHPGFGGSTGEFRQCRYYAMHSNYMSYIEIIRLSPHINTNIIPYKVPLFHLKRQMLLML